MKQGFYKILENKNIALDVYKMVLSGDTSAITAPGQFVNIKIDGLYLRRPISICDWSEDTITLIYKVVGKGTEVLSKMDAESPSLDLLVGLGNGYNTEKCGTSPLLIGGGVGVPPLYGLCKRLHESGVGNINVILGFNSAADVFYAEEFAKIASSVTVTTVDGSVGIKGFVSNAMPDIDHSYFYTCGPEPMLKAVYNATEADGQFSFEERMGCGFGACMGCSCKTKYGNKRICIDGPVLEKGEIIW